MHIVMISDSEWSGGAGIAASRLAHGFAGHGVRVTRLVPEPGQGARRSWEISQSNPSYARSIAFRGARKALIPVVGQVRWDGGWAHRWLMAKVRALRPDAINVHNMHGAGWPVEAVAECAALAPTVWTLHDMWSFTGRCVYSGGCDKYEAGCDHRCPTPAEYPALPPAQIANAWRRRRKALTAGQAQGRLKAASPSRWLAGLAMRGLWGDHGVESIPNGLDLMAFAPIDQPVARQRLGIPSDGPVLLAAAQQLSDPRKGMALLTSALNAAGQPGWTLVVFGHGQMAAPRDGMRIVHLGVLSDDASKAAAYSAADLYLHPALEDNLPNTVVESLACGTPVAALAIGGVPEMVRPGQTGWLAAEATPDGLARAIHAWSASGGTQPACRRACRAVAEAEYGQDLQARRYLNLFATMNPVAARSVRLPAVSNPTNEIVKEP